MLDTVVIGVGNRWRGDDAVGPVVIERLREEPPRGTSLLEADGDVTQILEAWRGASLAVVVDAVVSGDPPGTVHRLSGSAALPTTWRSPSSHLVGLAEAVELGAAVGCLPDELVIYGIEVDRVDTGEPLSGPADRAVAEVVAAVGRDLEARDA